MSEKFKSKALTINVQFGDPRAVVECKVSCRLRPSSPLVTRQSAWKLRKHPGLYARSGYRLVRADDPNTIWVATRPAAEYIPLIDRPSPRLVQ